MSESVIFKAAVKLTPELRPGYLNQACGNDKDLRQQVEMLLEAHEATNSFLQSEPAAAQPTVGYEEIGERPGTAIGHYKLMERIGEGGFGLVFVAEQQQPVRRRVALKIIKPGMDSREVVARFEMERQALALMDHPNIARVFDGGTTESGRPYFVMELVKGIPIVEYCDQQQLTAAKRLELFVSVCQAAQHAHSKGIVHRDLKPSNILIAPHDGFPVVKVIDFGIAKAIGQQLTDKTIYTRFSQMIGTPLYMSPKQAEINALDVDTRSDVYSLGVLLYELLTGTTPFERQRLQQAAFDEIRRIIREEEPPRPSTRLSTMGETLTKVCNQRGTGPAALSALIKGDLDWIVMKCLEKDRTRRYETAAGLAKDVQRFLADEPIEARPPSPGYRLQKFVRRHRGPVVTAGIVVTLLCLGLAGTFAGMIRARAAATRATEAESAALQNRDDKEKARAAESRERKTAERERDDARAAREELREALYSSNMNYLQTAWEADNTSRVLQILEDLRPGPGQKDLRGFEWHYWDRMHHSELRTLSLEFGPSPSKARGNFVALCGLGNTCAAITYLDPKKPSSLVIKAWNIADGSEVLSFPLDTAGVVRIALSGDGKRLAVAMTAGPGGKESAGQIVVWDIPTKKELATIPLTAPASEETLRRPYAIEPMLSHDGKRLVACLPGTLSPEGNAGLPVAMIWDIDGAANPLVFTHQGVLPGAVLSPDGSRLAQIVMTREKGNGGPIRWGLRLRNSVTGEVVATAPLATNSSPGGLDVDDRTLLAFSPDGSRVATIHFHRDRNSPAPKAYGAIWNGQCQMVCTFEPSHRSAYLSFNAGSNRLLTWFGDRNPVGTVWDAATGELLLERKGPVSPIVAASFVEGTGNLAAVDLRGNLHIWKSENLVHREPRSLDRQNIWSLDGSRRVEIKSGAPNMIHIFDAAGVERLQFLQHKAPILSARLSADGRFCISADESEMVKVWETDTGELKLDLPWKRNGARLRLEPLFSDDGHRLAMHLPEGGIKVWELTPKTREVLALREQVRSMVMSATGRRLAMLVNAQDVSGKRETELSLWDIDSAKQLIVQRGRFHRAAISPNGQFLAVQFSVGSERVGRFSSGASTAVQIWNADAPKSPIVLKGEAASSAMAFSPDSKLLATAAPHSAESVGDILLWDVATGEIRSRLQGHSAIPIEMAFSRDGLRLATTAQQFNLPQGELKLWEVSKGAEILALKTSGHLSNIHLLAFSADGHRLFAMSDVGLEIWQETWDAMPRQEPTKP